MLITTWNLSSEAGGRWSELLTNTGRNLCRHPGRQAPSPCPKSGGVNRFRAIDMEVGALFCNQCFSKKNGDGLAALGWLTDSTFAKTLDMLAQYLDAKPTKQGHALDWDSVIGAGSKMRQRQPATFWKPLPK